MDPMSAVKMLWPYEELPEWDAERCFALFMLHVEGQPNPAERDELSRQMMHLIGMHFGRNKTIAKFTSIGASPSDQAQSILVFLMGRIDRFKLQKPCYKTMISAIYQTIFRQVADAFEAHRGAVSLELTGERSSAGFHMPDLDGIFARLRRAEVIEVVIQDIPGDLALLMKTARHVRERLIAGESAEEIDHPPQGILDGQYALITLRLRNLLQSWVEQIAAARHR